MTKAICTTRRSRPRRRWCGSSAPTTRCALTYNEAFQVPNYSEFFLQANVAANANLSPFEAFCRPFGVSCGFDPDNSVATANTRVMALGNPTLEIEEVDSFEVGYSGIVGGRAYMTLDYYTSREHQLHHRPDPGSSAPRSAGSIRPSGPTRRRRPAGAGRRRPARRPRAALPAEHRVL